MAEANPKPLIAYVANVIEEQLHELDRRRVAAKPGPTQVVRPPFFVNENVFYTPLAQQVPTKVHTTADAKAMATANANALEHGGRLPEAVYPWLMEIDVTRRLTKAARTRPEKFRKTADPIEVDQEISRAREIKKDDPDISRRALAKEVADYFGRKARTVEEHLKPYFKK